jgi:hypothetical protein
MFGLRRPCDERKPLHILWSVWLQDDVHVYLDVTALSLPYGNHKIIRVYCAHGAT